MSEKFDNRRFLSFFERSNAKNRGFVVKQTHRKDRPELHDDLPVPDGQTLKYGQSQRQYLESGKRDAETLRRALVESGLDDQLPGNILEFGCANARVLRWFFDWAQRGEAWGVDIDSDLVFWCHENLSPPFHFAVSTTAPHLFFEDQFFGLVFGYSVFTHIDDLYLSWICELRRVIRSGGFLAVTMNDVASQQLQVRQNRDPKRFAKIYGSKIFQQFQATDADYVAVGRDMQSQITVKRDYFVQLFSHAFDVLNVVENTMGGHQTLLIMKRK